MWCQGKVFQALEAPVHRETWEQFCCVGESAGAKSGTEVRTGVGESVAGGAAESGQRMQSNMRPLAFCSE